VNCKLTDFGASRNVNQLMTNMTFTKGIGTPAFMAPEVLNKQRYKKPADMFAFAVTMYETFMWEQAYPKKQFKFPWKIAEFITNGDRLEIHENLEQEHFELIQKCWKQEPKERLIFDEIIPKLE
jgi:serine/threonine protein kinase